MCRANENVLSGSYDSDLGLQNISSCEELVASPTSWPTTPAFFWRCQAKRHCGGSCLAVFAKNEKHPHKNPKPIPQAPEPSALAKYRIPCALNPNLKIYFFCAFKQTRTALCSLMPCSQNGLKHGRNHGRAMDALFSERIRPWTASCWGHRCSVIPSFGG